MLLEFSWFGYFFFSNFFLFVELGLKLTAHTSQATPPALFCDGVFQDRVSQTICLG
jgi:hypothetical protein